MTMKLSRSTWSSGRGVTVPAVWAVLFFESRHSLVVLIEGSYPFVGQVTWLTPAQGGRPGGVPPALEGVSYAHVAYVLPRSIEGGLASFVLRGWDPERWRSQAEGRWLVAGNDGDQHVIAGSVIVVCEGAHEVAHFRVEEVRAV
jgi:hypothetical protein